MQKIYKFGYITQGKQYITINGGYITIKRKGLFQMLFHGLKGEKTINIRNITAVQVKKPGFMTGYLQFAIMGSQESKGGINKAVQDENTVIFASNKQYKQALEIKDYIERYNSQPNPEQIQYIQSNVSVADELKKLKELLDSGVLTQEEFDEQKKKLLQ